MAIFLFIQAQEFENLCFLNGSLLLAAGVGANFLCQQPNGSIGQGHHALMSRVMTPTGSSQFWGIDDFSPVLHPHPWQML